MPNKQTKPPGSKIRLGFSVTLLTTAKLSTLHLHASDVLKEQDNMDILELWVQVCSS